MSGASDLTPDRTAGSEVGDPPGANPTATNVPPTSTPSQPEPQVTVLWLEPPGVSVPQGSPSVTLKFAEGLTVRLTDIGLVGLGPPADYSDAAAVIARYPVIDVVPVFSRPVAELEAERRLAQQRTGTLPPDLTLYFIMRLAEGASAEALAAGLERLDSVETAYVTPRPAPPP